MPITRLRPVGIALTLAAATIGVCSAVPPAVAQDGASSLTRRRPADPVRPTTVPVPDGLFGDQAAAPDLPAVIPSDDASAVMAEATDDDSDQPRAGQRPILKDGDLSDPVAPMLRDGVIDITEPAAPIDGADPSAVDLRPKEEADLFEAPASTVDALLFQIEELDPILDKRPQRLFRFEPYDPIGVRVGSFVLFPEMEIGGNAFSNVFRAPRARSDVSFDVRPSARLVSNWRRHALEFNARGAFSFYNEFTTENETAYALETRGRLDVSKRTNVQATLSRDVAQESRSAIEARTAGTRADVVTDVATVALNHRFNRLGLQLRGSVTDRAYGASETGGVATLNDARDFATYEQAVRASWEFKPTLSVFSEVAINQRDYGRTDASGIDRSSRGERYRVGLSFGTTGEFLRGEAGAGWGVQHPAGVGLPDVSGVIIDANVTYRPTTLTAVALTARSDFGETTNAGSGGVRSQFFGAEVRHGFRRDVIATAGLGYTTSDYVGTSLSEDELRATLGVEYFLNRETVLFSRYVHTAFTSNAANASYDADELRVGVRIRR